MKKYLCGTLVVLSAVFSLTVHASIDERLILSLEKVIGDDVSSKIELYSSNIDPNLKSIEDTYTLYINGVNSNMHQEPVLEDLARGRRSFSYDSLSGGIKHQETKASCMMAVLPAGYRLKVRYLEYKNMEIIGDSMKTILSVPINCRYSEGVRPVSQTAELEAMRTLGKLETLGLILQEEVVTK